MHKEILYSCKIYCHIYLWNTTSEDYHSNKQLWPTDKSALKDYHIFTETKTSIRKIFIRKEAAANLIYITQERNEQQDFHCS